MGRLFHHFKAFNKKQMWSTIELGYVVVGQAKYLALHLVIWQWFFLVVGCTYHSLTEFVLNVYYQYLGNIFCFSLHRLLFGKPFKRFVNNKSWYRCYLFWSKYCNLIHVLCFILTLSQKLLEYWQVSKLKKLEHLRHVNKNINVCKFLVDKCLLQLSLISIRVRFPTWHLLHTHIPCVYLKNKTCWDNEP